MKHEVIEYNIVLSVFKLLGFTKVFLFVLSFLPFVVEFLSFSLMVNSLSFFLSLGMTSFSCLNSSLHICMTYALLFHYDSCSFLLCFLPDGGTFTSFSVFVVAANSKQEQHRDEFIVQFLTSAVELHFSETRWRTYRNKNEPHHDKNGFSGMHAR